MEDDSNRIRKERLRIPMTQEQLANEIGVSNVVVSGWENGTLPNANNLKSLAKFFGCSVDYLLGLTDRRKGRK